MNPGVGRQVRHIQSQQHMTLLAREVLRLIELFGKGKTEREMLRGGKVRIFVDDVCRGHSVGMLIELSADLFIEFRPGHERGSTRVRRDEAFAVVMNEVEEILSLLLI